MRRTVILALAVAAAACGNSGSSSKPKELQPTGLRVVAGDNQVGQVVVGSTGATAQVDVLPDTLVMQIVGDTVSASASADILGPSPNAVAALPSAISIPTGTSVSFSADEDGCGASFLSSTTPDSLGRVKTLWEIPGSRDGLTAVLPTDRLGWHMVAGDSVWSAECHILAHLGTGSGFSADTFFTGYFQPGPATSLGLPVRIVYRIGMDDTVDLGQYGAPVDAVGNAWPRSLISWGQATAWAPDTEATDTATASLDSTTANVVLDAVAPMSAGWTVTIRCGAGTVPIIGGGRTVDSVSVAATVDSLRFRAPADAGFAAGYDVVATYQYTYSASGALFVSTQTSGAVFGVDQSPGRISLAAFAAGWDTIPAAGNPPTAFVYTGATSHLCGTAPVREEAIRAPGG